MADRDAYALEVGPIHAGIIESGHFHFQVMGERILGLEARLGYKRRGLEAAACGQPLSAGIAYVQRACAACAVANTLAYALAAEQLLGMRVAVRVRHERTVLAELERLYNHLNDISAICAGVGFAPGVMAYAALKERSQRLNQALSGHRFLFGSVAIGASPVSRSIDEHRQTIVTELNALAAEHAVAWRELRFARSLQERLDGVGTLSRDDAVRLGAVGPVARAAGVVTDARTTSPGLVYAGLEPAVAADPTGDVAARFNQRALELDQSFALLRDLLGSLPGPDRTETAPLAGTAAHATVESPRGATNCTIVWDGNAIADLRLTTGSHLNWPVLAHTVVGNVVPDFPLINKSFELCYACSDR